MSTFKSLLDLQGELITALYETEKIDYHFTDSTISYEPSKEFLMFLKNLSSEAIEETYELHQSYTELAVIVVAAPNGNSPSGVAITSHLNETGSEAADLLHFILEICLFSDYDESSLQLAIYEEAQIWDIRSTEESEDEIKTMLTLATFHNAKDSMISPNNFNPLLFRSDIQLRPHSLIGHEMSAQSIEVTRERYMELIEELIVLRRTFAAKKWKTNIEAPPILQVHKQITRVLLSYFKLIDLMGGNAEALVYHYIRKNAENLTRIKNNY
jgi:hypothetical protein